MESFLIQSIFSLNLLALLTVIGMHVVKKNKAVLHLYAMQSLSTGLLLLSLGFLYDDVALMIVALLTVVIKAVAAPHFFGRLGQHIRSESTSNNYLSTPLSLLVIMSLLIFAYSDVLTVFVDHASRTSMYLPVNFAIIFISFFLMFNRRGARGQILGILSFENGVVLLVALLHIAQPIWLEIGIIFNLVLWIVIAQVFVQMVYRQFGTLNVTEMRRLTEE